MRRLSASFVVTALSVSCSREPSTVKQDHTPEPKGSGPAIGNPPEPEPKGSGPAIGNPPEPVPRKRKVTQKDVQPKQAKPFDWSKATTLNPSDANNRTIMVGGNRESCFVELPFPPGEQITSWRPSPTAIASCPISMDDPAWDYCVAGTLHKIEDRCVCTRDGNPPGPPTEAPCPK